MNEPAFQSTIPSVVMDEKVLGHYEGISVRDYFAAKAMQGIITGVVSQGINTTTEDIERVAKASMAIADAMLKERSKDNV